MGGLWLSTRNICEASRADTEASSKETTDVSIASGLSEELGSEARLVSNLNLSVEFSEDTTTGNCKLGIQLNKQVD